MSDDFISGRSPAIQLHIPLFEVRRPLLFRMLPLLACESN